MAGSAALAAGGLALPAVASAAPTEEDLAYANFGIAAELMLVDFYDRLAKAGRFQGQAQGAILRARANEAEHATALTTIVVAAGQPAPVPEDFERTWPRGAFAAAGAAARLGLRLERAVLGAYLAGARDVSDAALRGVLARLAASEAAHVSVLSGLSAGRPIGAAFPVAMDLEAATNVVGPYLG
jgi:rubrerythrin